MPLILEGVGKVHRRRGRGATQALADIHAAFEPGRSVAILGGPGSGKSTLMQILAGSLQPTAGRIRRASRVSYVAGANPFANSRTTIREAIAFAARLYGANVRQVVDFVADFAELGSHMSHPIDAHSRDSREVKQRLLYTLSYALPFDIYLGDENLTSGSPEFRERCAALIHERRRSAGLVFATRNVRNATAFATEGAVLHEGRLAFYPTLEEAIAAYEALNPRWQAYTQKRQDEEEDEEEDEADVVGLF